MSEKNKKQIYLFEDGKIKKGQVVEKKQNYFERLFDEEAEKKADPNLPFEKIRKEAKREELAKKITRAMLFLLVLFCISLAVISLFFKVESVDVVGDHSYNSADIIEHTGLSKKNMLFIDGDELERAIKFQFPEIGEVKVEKQFPGKIILHIVSNKPKMYIDAGGEYYILSDKLDVMKLTLDKKDTVGLIQLEMGNPKSLLVGKFAEFFDEYTYDYIVDAISQINDREIAKKITKLDFSDKFDIKAEYDGRITVLFGNSDSLGVKCTLAYSYIDTLGEDEKGVIYAQNTSEGSFLSYDTD